MPVCFITVSEKTPELTSENIEQIRKYVAEGLDSKSRKLDENHIAMRFQKSERKYMLGDVEIDIFSQLYLRRLFSRDKRANYISNHVANCLNCCCATWINMGYVGYSRENVDGSIYYSDSNNRLLHWLQKKRGISTNP